MAFRQLIVIPSFTEAQAHSSGWMWQCDTDIHNHIARAKLNWAGVIRTVARVEALQLVIAVAKTHACNARE